MKGRRHDMEGAEQGMRRDETHGESRTEGSVVPLIGRIMRVEIETCGAQCLQDDNSGLIQTALALS